MDSPFDRRQRESREATYADIERRLRERVTAHVFENWPVHSGDPRHLGPGALRASLYGEFDD